MLERTVAATAAALGTDGDAYRGLLSPLVSRWDQLASEVLRPVTHMPRHPLLLARFGLHAMRSARGLASAFQGEAARALVAGCAAHSFLPLERPFTAAFALMFLVTGNAVGWPLPRGGSRRITDALASYLQELGGTITTRHLVQQLTDVPTARAYVFDTSPWHLEGIAADRLPAGYRRALRRYRRGPGVFKVDYALDGAVPWRAAECLRAGTVHVGGTFDDISPSE